MYKAIINVLIKTYLFYSPELLNQKESHHHLENNLWQQWLFRVQKSRRLERFLFIYSGMGLLDYLKYV